jgi:hypothetical protein
MSKHALTNSQPRDKVKQESRSAVRGAAHFLASALHSTESEINYAYQQRQPSHRHEARFADITMSYASTEMASGEEKAMDDIGRQR